MHTITHCFFSQSRLYSSHPWTFRSFNNLAPTQCMLNKAHVCTHYAKSGTRPPHRPHACIRPLHIFLLPYSFYASNAAIALTLMLLCNVSYALFLIYLFRLGRRFRHQDIHFFTTHAPFVPLLSLLIPPVD